MHTFSILRRAVIAATVLTATAMVSRAADTFEGRVEMQVTNSQSRSKDPHTMEYIIKGDRMRMNMNDVESGKKGGAQSVGILIDFNKREVLTLIDSPDHKMYMRHALPDPKDQTKEHTKAHKADTDDTPVSDPVKTGRTDTIAGYPATEYTMTDKDGNTHDLWLGKGLGSYLSPGAFQNARSRASQASPAWEKLVREGNFFPLRVVTHDKTGTEVSRMEVTKVEKMTVPESTFSTEGYQEFQMPSFGAKDALKGLMGR